MHSDWPRIVSYLVIITSPGVIIARFLNYKMTVLEVINTIGKNKILKSTKGAIQFDVTLFKRKI